MDLIKIALQEYGEKDIFGIKNNARIVSYFKYIGAKWVINDDTAWCACFVNWVLLMAGLPQTGSLSARSFLKYGSLTSEPEIGDIVVLWRITKDGPFGHVGFFIKQDATKIWILGGNQNDQVNIMQFDRTRVLEYRKVPEIKHNTPQH